MVVEILLFIEFMTVIKNDPPASILGVADDRKQVKFIDSM